MTKDIFSLKKEIDFLNDKLELLKTSIIKNNIIIYSIYTLILVAINLFNFNIYSFLIKCGLIFITSIITSRLINNVEIKKKKQIENNLKIKKNELNNLIQNEIIKKDNINYVNDINKNMKFNSLEEIVIHNKLQSDYKYNLKKVKKKIRRR